MASVLLRSLTLLTALQIASSRALLDTGRNVENAAPDTTRDVLDEPIAGTYVVMFKPGTGTAAQATSILQQQLSQKVAAASVADDGSTSSSSSSTSSTSSTSSSNAIGFTVVGSLGSNSSTSTSSAVPSVATVKAFSTSGSRGVQGIVVQASAAAVQHIKQSELVAAVFADRVVKTQVDACVDAKYLSSGTLTATPSSSLKWPNCLDATSKLVWVGKRCGSDMTQIEYTAIYAFNVRSGRLRVVNGQQCVLTADPNRPAWHRQRFGACGRAPLYAQSLPTRTCSATGGGSPNCITASGVGETTAATVTSKIMLRYPTTCNGKLAMRLTYTGVACGAANELVQWTEAVTPDGCILRAGLDPQQTKWNYDVFGSCGVPPGNATATVTNTLCPPNTGSNSGSNPTSPAPDPNPNTVSSPSPSPGTTSPDPTPTPNTSPSPADSPSPQTPSSPSPAPLTPQSLLILPRVPLTPNDQVPSGVLRIEGLTAAGVVSTTGLPVSSQVTIGVIDSGIDGTHPDLNVVGGVSWVVGGSADVEASQADALTDGYGHGTHVAGIVAAKNNGAGVVGVSPGSPLYSLKVLDSNGKGSLSSVLAALNWVITEGLAKGIKVLNLSLAAYVDPSSADYADTLSAVCTVFQQASDAGVLVTVAAGNYASNMQGYLPASCPSVAAVTAVNADGTGVSSYSNWLADSSADGVKAQIIAAPGTNILSTVPYARDPSGYKVLSGTSMAAPHVAGVAANCIMSGACTAGATGQQIFGTMQSIAQQRLTFSKYGFSGDATSTINGKYFGYLLWSGF